MQEEVLSTTERIARRYRAHRNDPRYVDVTTAPVRASVREIRGRPRATLSDLISTTYSTREYIKYDSPTIGVTGQPVFISPNRWVYGLFIYFDLL